MSQHCKLSNLTVGKTNIIEMAGCVVCIVYLEEKTLKSSNGGNVRVAGGYSTT